MDNVEFSLDNFGFPLGIQTYNTIVAIESEEELDREKVEKEIVASNRVKSLPPQFYIPNQ